MAQRDVHGLNSSDKWYQCTNTHFRVLQTVCSLMAGFGRMGFICAQVEGGRDGAQQPVWHLYTRTFKLCLLWRCLCFCDAWQTRVLFFFFYVQGQLLHELVAYWVCFCPPACFLACFMSTICNSAAPLFPTSVWFARNRIDKWGVTAAEHFGAKKLVNEVMLWFWDPDSPSPGYQELDFLGL